MIRLLSFCCFIAVASTSFAYGPIGHEMVGAIADELLKDKPVYKKVMELTEGITLKRASVIPDEIKAWDKKGPDDPKTFPHYKDHPEIDAQLREFWRANPPSHDATPASPTHHWFHYTDVPVMTATKYAAGKAGRRQWDVVHMIPYCISVLRGETPEDNPRKITKGVAIILLVHYVGDIHQPLHVGAEYFSQTGEPTDPESDTNALEDQGGNTLAWTENATGQRPKHYYHSLHGYWDQDVVRNLVIGTPDELPKEQRAAVYTPAIEKVLTEFTTHEPKKWRTDGDPKTWAVQWADEILPLAREAHTRLRFQGVHREEKDGQIFAKGRADEIGSGYREWSTQLVHDELHKAGWRLAALLEQTVGSTKSAELKPATAPPAKEAAVPTSETATSREILAAPPATAQPTSPSTATPNIPTPVATPPSPYGSYPTNYKEVVSEWVRVKGIDPARIDWQTQPKPAVLPDATGRQVVGYLVIFNVGAKTRSVLIHDGAVINAAGF